jgi:membrane-bound metal-dependent hydrolase YbcI (DUF457 family)
MPFTPFHFGAHACASLPFHRQLDVPVFIAANVVIDIEPLIVLVFKPDYPLHGYAHTLLVGGMLGLLFGLAVYPFRRWIGLLMGFLRMRYRPNWGSMAISGMLGAWLHVLFDAPLYGDIRPFYPFQENPLLGILSPGSVYAICLVLFVPAVLLYVYLAFVAKRGNVDDN